MTEQELEGLAPALCDFLEGFCGCFVSRRTLGHLKVYARGLLSDLPRKTAEPIALQAGTSVRTLQEFLKDHCWDFARVRQVLQQQVAAALTKVPDADDLGTIAIIDEQGTPKKGDKRPAVQ